MRRTFAAMLLAVAASSFAFAQSNAEAARQELEAGGRLYRAGKYAEAEARFRRALELDPEGKETRTFIARAAVRQYRPGVMTPENLAAGERAVAAYQEVLKKDPADEDAHKAVVYLYGQMRQEEKVDEFLLARANDFSAPNGTRAEAFTTLAAKQWQCSYNITEQPGNKKPAEKKPDENKPEDDKKPEENRTAAGTQAAPAVVYAMPADGGDFIRARQCATDGLAFVEQALALDPRSQAALFNKARLLREAVKLAQMEGDLGQEAEFVRRSQEAQEAFEARRNEAKAQDVRGVLVAPTQPPPDPAAAPGAPPGKTVVSGGVLNSKAVSKPMPAYPREAKAAGAQGTVTVQILVDEDGRVVSARAVSGHPLLQEAAVAAARQARFSPTRLSGQPVKVSGVVTYNFVLQ